MRVNLSVTHLAKFHGPRPILWHDLWLLKIGYDFYHMMTTDTPEHVNYRLYHDM